MYGEIIIAINMLFNFAILSFADRMGNAQASWKRLLLASFVGAVPVTLFPNSWIALFVAFAFMVFCAFGVSFTTWGNKAFIVLIGALFAGGLLTVVTERFIFVTGPSMIFISAILAYAALAVFKMKWLDVRLARKLSTYAAESMLTIWDKDVPISVFVDTGNRCTEPLTGEAVHFVSFQAVKPIIPSELLEPLQAWDPKGVPQLSVFPKHYQQMVRLIRLQTVQGNSWAVGIKFDRWTITKGCELPAGYLVLTKQDRRYPEGAQAILHVSALEFISNERGTSYVA